MRIDVRDAFLDNVETALIGVENDPKIAEQVDEIPESDEFELTDEEMDELDSLEESISNIPDFY